MPPGWEVPTLQLVRRSCRPPANEGGSFSSPRGAQEPSDPRETELSGGRPPHKGGWAQGREHPPKGGWAQGREDEHAPPHPQGLKNSSVPGPLQHAGGHATRAGARRKLRLCLESARAALKIPRAALQGCDDLHPPSQNHPPRLSRKRQTHTCRRRRPESAGRARAQPGVAGPESPPNGAGASRWSAASPHRPSLRPHRPPGLSLRPQPPPEETSQ